MKFTFNEIETIHNLVLERYEWLEKRKTESPEDWVSEYYKKERKEHASTHSILLKIEGETF